MRVYRVMVSMFFGAYGVALLIGGTWLAVIGGSTFYALAGAATLLSGACLIADIQMLFVVYTFTLVGTFFWALWEVEMDWWALFPRGALLVISGLLLMPLAWRRSEMFRDNRLNRTGATFTAATLVTIVTVGLYAASQDPHDTPDHFSVRPTVANGEMTTAGIPDGDWQAYGRTTFGRRYSPWDQITPTNVEKLKVAWTYQTCQIRSANDPADTTYEVTPFIFNDTMFVCTPFSTVIALDPVTGAEKWRFDPQLKQPPVKTTQHMTCRGVTYYDGSHIPTPMSVQTVADSSRETDDARVAASSAETTQAAGVPQNVVAGTAKAGDANPRVDLKSAVPTIQASPDCVLRLFVPVSDGRLIFISAKTRVICPGFGGDVGTINLWANMPNITPGSVYSTSPPVMTDHLVVVGGAVNDNVATTSLSGVIRVFDVFSGDLVWNFDAKNSQVTAPIANGQTYSENAPNGWSVSSYDPAFNMIYLPMGNQSPDQYGAKRTHEGEKFSSSVLALDDETGKVAWVLQTVHHDLWDMDVPAQPVLVDLTINGQTVPALVQATKQGEMNVLDRRTGKPILPVTEEPAPSGAVSGDFASPTQPVPANSFLPKLLTESDIWGVTPLDRLWCRIRFHELNYRGCYTPPSERGSIIYPGKFGVFNWGSVAVDPQRQVLFELPVYHAFTSQLIKRPETMSRVVTGKTDPVFNENFGAEYASKMSAFPLPLGLPCQQPPWPYVAGVDLTTGKTAYQHVYDTVQDLSPIPLRFRLGVPGIGGPIVTGGGMAFLSGTLDYYVRRYELSTGAEVWRARLPAGGQATPSTYLGRDGRQYLVVVSGGHGSTGTKAGDSVITYALSN